MKSPLTRQKLEERLLFLEKKKRVIENFKKMKGHYYKPTINLSGLEKEINQIEQQLNMLSF